MMTTEHERPLTEQLAEARTAADTAHATYQQRHELWANKLWFMAGNIDAIHGPDLMTQMNGLHELAQSAYAAHREAAIADSVLAGLSELAKRQQTGS
jgi:hypothetical protein